MKHIIKDKESHSLTEYRLNCTDPNISYESMPQNVKRDVQAALLEEQGCICCYCMQRISQETMKIEHWTPRSISSEVDLDYKNLLGSCKGNEGQPEHLQHCDTHKGNTKITIHPADPNKNCEAFIKFSSNGLIYSDDSTISDELNIVLNLNIQTLQNHRKSVWKAVQQGLSMKYRHKTCSKADIEKEIEKWKTKFDGQYHPYCRVAVYYLQKRLRRANR